MDIKSVINVVDGKTITIEDILKSSYQLLRYKAGNYNTDVLMHLIKLDLKARDNVNFDSIALELGADTTTIMECVISLAKKKLIFVSRIKEYGFTTNHIFVDAKAITLLIETEVKRILSLLDDDSDILGVEIRTRDTNKPSNKENGLWMDLHVKYASDLSSDEKIVLSEVLALHHVTEEGVYKGNESFAKLINKDKRTVRRVIRSLKDKGYLKNENRLVYSDKTTVQKRYLVPTFFGLTGREEERFKDKSFQVLSDETEPREDVKKVKVTDEEYTQLNF